MVQSKKDSQTANDALAVYKEFFAKDLEELKKENKEVVKCVAEIRAIVPFLALKTDITTELNNVMDKHVEQFHKKNTSRSIPRPTLTNDNYKKVVGSLIAVIAALVAVIYFLIGNNG